MSTPKQQYYENLADSLIDKFNLRGIEGYYCENKEDALLTAKRFLTPGCSVSWGGSMTLEEIGLIDALKNSDYTVFDRTMAKSPEERDALFADVSHCDCYFMSSNAITLDGQLVNIDGMGNRVASLIHGPKNVIIVAGMNKVVSTLDAALDRVHNEAAPPNALRLGLNTPCAKFGRCVDCLDDNCICCQTVITRKSRISGRIKVILVGEELGY